MKVTVAVGGATQKSWAFSKMAATEISRAKFIAASVRFLKKHNFDGLDIDWEFPGKFFVTSQKGTSRCGKWTFSTNFGIHFLSEGVSID